MVEQFDFETRDESDAVAPAPQKLASVSSNFRVKWGAVGAGGKNHEQNTILPGWLLEQSGHDLQKLVDLGAVEESDEECVIDLKTVVNPASDRAPELQAANDRLRAENAAFAKNNAALDHLSRDTVRRREAAERESATKTAEIDRLITLSSERKLVIDETKADHSKVAAENVALKAKIAELEDRLTAPDAPVKKAK